MGHESRIEPWSPHLTTCCFAGFGTDRLRCEEAMKTAGRENPNRWANVPSNRAHGTAVQNKSCSIKWAVTQENVQPLERCFFLTSTFIGLSKTLALTPAPSHIIGPMKPDSVNRNTPRYAGLLQTKEYCQLHQGVESHQDWMFERRLE